MSSSRNFGICFIFLLVILLTEGPIVGDAKFDKFGPRFRHDNGFNLDRPWNNIWGGLFSDNAYAYDEPYYKVPLDPLAPLLNLFRPVYGRYGYDNHCQNCYENNYSPYQDNHATNYDYNPAPKMYENSQSLYEKPIETYAITGKDKSYENVQPSYEKPTETYAHSESYANAGNAGKENSYEKPIETYAHSASYASTGKDKSYENVQPSYEKPLETYSDCSDNKCGNVVFQPIIYVGPNTYNQQEVSMESIEEEKSEKPANDNQYTQQVSTYEENINKEEHVIKDETIEKDSSEEKNSKENKNNEEEKKEVEKHFGVQTNVQYISPPSPIPVQYYTPHYTQVWSPMPVNMMSYVIPQQQMSYYSTLPAYNLPPTVATLPAYNIPTTTPTYNACNSCAYNNIGAPTPNIYATGNI